ncbi:hypothetical protein BH23ACT4_BH23ACT4_04260 [soil metagenome]
MLLLSPDAAASQWVNQEIEYWKTHREPSRILPVLTDGTFEWTDGDVAGSGVPESFREVFSEEPRWVDLRFAQDENQLDRKNPRFSAAVADIASALRGVPKDELESEEVKQHRRTVRTACDATLRLYSLPDGIERWSYTEETTDSFGIPFVSPNGEMVTVGIWDSTTRLAPGGRSPDDLPARVVVLDASDGSVIDTVEYPDCVGAMGLGWSSQGSYFAISHFQEPCPREGASNGSWVEILDGKTFDQLALVETIETSPPLTKFDGSENLYVFGEGRRGLEIYPSPEFHLDRVIEEAANPGDISPDGHWP